MAASSNLNVKLEDASKSCATCKIKKDVTTPGVKFCVQCVRWMCSSCLQAHDLICETHTLTDSPNDDSATPKLSADHKDFNMTFFCNDCKRCVCPVGRLDDSAHKTHDCVSINERIDVVRKDIQAAIAKLKTTEKTAEDKLCSLHQQFSAASDRLRESEEKIRKEIKNLADEHQKMKNEVEKELIEKKDAIAKEIIKLQQCLIEADVAVDLTDTSTLIDDRNLQLPQLGEFRGLHEAGIQMLVGADLSDEQKVQVLKAIKPHASTPVGLHEAVRELMLGEDLSDQQKIDLLKSVKPVTTTPQDLHKAGLSMMLGDDVIQKRNSELLEIFRILLPSEGFDLVEKIMKTGDSNIDRSSKITLLTSRGELDHQQITKSLNCWNIRPSQLTVQQQAGLIRTGSRVRRGRDWNSEWTSDGDNGLGTAAEPVDSNGRVTVRWDCSGKSHYYSMGRNNNYQLTLAD